MYPQFRLAAAYAECMIIIKCCTQEHSGYSHKVVNMLNTLSAPLTKRCLTMQEDKQGESNMMLHKLFISQTDIE